MAKETEQVHPHLQSLPLGLSFVAGLGMTVMIVVLALGVIQGVDADGQALGIGFFSGLVLFVAGVAGWMAVVRPHTHFDNIEVARYHGHHHDAHSEEHAIVAHEGAEVKPHP